MQVTHVNRPIVFKSYSELKERATYSEQYRIFVAFDRDYQGSYPYGVCPECEHAAELTNQLFHAASCSFYGVLSSDRFPEDAICVFGPHIRARLLTFGRVTIERENVDGLKGLAQRGLNRGKPSSGLSERTI